MLQNTSKTTIFIKEFREDAEKGCKYCRDIGDTMLCELYRDWSGQAWESDYIDAKYCPNCGRFLEG